MAELWLPEVDGPYPLCAPCAAGNHPSHLDLHWVWKDGIDYGPMACPCICDDENLLLAMYDQPPKEG